MLIHARQFARVLRVRHSRRGASHVRPSLERCNRAIQLLQIAVALRDVAAGRQFW